MTCKKALELIYLSREGELLASEMHDLDLHLQSCQGCSQERAAINALNRYTSQLREVTPVPPDQVGLTHAIMRALAHQDEARTVRIDTPWNVLFAPRFRVALGLTLLLAGGILLLQTDRDARRIAALEERLSRGDRSRTSIPDLREAAAFLPPQDALGDFAKVLGKVLPGVAHNGDAARFVDSLAGLPSDAGQHRITFGQLLLKKYPGLATVRFDDGLDQHERQILATEGKPFLDDVKALIQKGEEDHER